MKDEILDRVIALNKQVLKGLWELKNAKTGLIFPLISGVPRVSEQESRFIYASLLSAGAEFSYAVETPTNESYRFKGLVGYRRAASDLSLFDAKREKLANIEFKALNPPVDSIKKDIEKLVREGIFGNWVHTLENVDSGTFRSLFGKLSHSFEEVKSKGHKKGPLSILFSFCVIEQKWGCIRHFSCGANDDISRYAKMFFESEGKEQNVQKSLEIRGWTIIAP